MTNLWPLGLLLCSCLLTTMAGHMKPKQAPKYWIEFSKICSPDVNKTILVCTRNVREMTYLRLDLYDCFGYSLQKGETYSISPSDYCKTIHFELWEKLKKPFHTVFIRLTAWGGFRFDVFRQLVWRSKRLAVLTQLDRNVYKPGMSVHFRTLAMHTDGRVADERIVTVLRDPFYNVVGKWKGMKGSGKQGVHEGTVLSPPNPVLGEYSIKTSVDGVSKTKYFTMRRSEEPDFILKLWIPKADYYATFVKARVFVNYTIGTPVCGKGTLKIQFPRYYYYWWWYARFHIKEVAKQFSLDIYGRAVVKFPRKDLLQTICRYYYPWIWYYYPYRCYYANYFLRYRRLKFIAEVTDDASQQVVKKIKEVYITASKSRLTFTPDTPYKFKPSLPFTAFVQDIKINGRPNNNPFKSYLTFTVTYTKTSAWGTCTSRWYWYWRWRQHRYELLQENVDLDAEKIAKLKIKKVPADACTLYIKASNDKFTVEKTISRYYSKNGEYLYMEVDKTPTVGKKTRGTLMSNVKFRNFTIMGYSRGKMVFLKEVHEKEPATEHRFACDVDETMKPVIHLVGRFISKSGEVVADAISSLVRDDSNKMLVHIRGKTEATTKPNDGHTTMTVEASNDSWAFFLGKDEHTLTKRNDIKQEDATAAKMAHDLSTYGNKYRYIAHVHDMYKSLGVHYFTNFDVPGSYYYYFSPKPKPYRWSYYYYRTWFYDWKKIGPFAVPPAKWIKTVQKCPREEEKLYRPPTRLWKAVKITSNVGTVEIDTPKTLSSMNISGFGVDSEQRLTFIEVPVMLTVKKNVFISIYGPLKAVYKEICCGRIIAHNTGQNEATLTLTLRKNMDFDYVEIKNDRGHLKEEFIQRNVKRELGLIKAGTKKTAFYCIRPKVNDSIELRVKVSGDGKHDLNRIIKVKPETKKKSKTYQFLVKIGSSGEFSETITVNLPCGVVNGLFSVSSTMTGIPLLVTAHKMSNLVMTPTGCGEETILQLSVLSRIIAYYLTDCGHLPEGLLTKTKHAMHAAYWETLSYRRYDNSFSSFGNCDNSGYVWMTALTAQSLSGVSDMELNGIYVERTVIKGCIDFITAHQNPGGSFVEVGKLFLPYSQGSSADSEIFLTSFVALALLDTENYLNRMKMEISLFRVSCSLDLAKSFLEKHLDTDCRHCLAIMAYALRMLKSPKAVEALQKMNETLTVEDDKMHVDNDVVASSYALMALTTNGFDESAERVYSWLYTKLNARGEFNSLQETIIGMQALTMMKLALKKTLRNMTITVKVVHNKPEDMHKSSNFSVTPVNAFKLQKSDMNWEATHKPVEIKVTGKALPTLDESYAYAAVTVTYGEQPKQIAVCGKLSISAHVLYNTIHSFMLKVCVKHNPLASQADNYLIKASVNFPTGFAVSEQASRCGHLAAKVHLDERRLTMYYTKLNGEDCSTVMFKMIKGKVAYVKHARVKVMNMYNTSEKCMTNYHLEQHGLCEVVPDYPGCQEMTETGRK